MAGKSAEPELFINNNVSEHEESANKVAAEADQISTKIISERQLFLGGNTPEPDSPVSDEIPEPEPQHPLTITKRTFTEIYEGKVRFVYRLILTKRLDAFEKLSWEAFIAKQKYLFNISDNSQSDIFIARTKETKDFVLTIIRSIHFSEERFLKYEFDQQDCDTRFHSFVSDIFKQFILWKLMRDFKPKEESKVIFLEDLGINSDDYPLK